MPAAREALPRRRRRKASARGASAQPAGEGRGSKRPRPPIRPEERQTFLPKIARSKPPGMASCLRRARGRVAFRTAAGQPAASLGWPPPRNAPESGDCGPLRRAASQSTAPCGALPLEPRDARRELRTSLVDAGPHGIQGNPLEAGDLLPAVAADLEQNQRGALRLRKIRQESLEDRSSLFLFQSALGVPRAREGPRERVVDPAAVQEEPEPPKPPEIAHAMARDLIEPPVKVLPVEIGQPTVDDEKHVLHEVIPLGPRATEGPDPPANVAERRAIDLLELLGLGLEARAGMGARRA